GSAAATTRDRKRALGACVVLVAAFALTLPWASRPLRAVPAFAPIYDAAVIVLDVLTALLLYAQYRQLRERSLLALTCAYAFTPMLIAAHALSFPDAYRPGSLIGGSQTSAWLWMGLHTLFPVFVIGYAVLARGDRDPDSAPPAHARSSAGVALSATIVLALGVVAVTVFADSMLPPLMVGSAYRSPATRAVLVVGWLAHALALVALARATRMRRLIDLWMGVTLVALMIDLALSALLVGGRYQLGFYLGRVYGLLAASFVLAALLREASALYGKALRFAEVESREGLRRQLIAAEEEERRRLARELHDEVGQHITALSLGIRALTDITQAHSEVDRRAQSLLPLVDSLGRELHSVAVRLRPKALDDFGLEAALESYATDWSRSTGIIADVHARAASERLPSAIEGAIYRIVQEALTNVARHSGATRASIFVERRDGQVVTVIEDDGHGFDTSRFGEGLSPDGRLGLIGMRERAALLGGTVEIESTPGDSTTVYARIPVGSVDARVDTLPATAGVER
ncbi:MAG TPA: sensor histidine kinase, partial [Gemmatimonadaceae bacterium]|nr:sensor histidine kinase [Gemmatimonadaceae bacterium]